MKKLLIFPAAALALLLLLAAAFAEGPSGPALFELNVEEGYDLQVLGRDGAAAAAVQGEAEGWSGTLYIGAARLKLSFSGLDGEEYVVLLLRDCTVPTQAGLCYAEQLSGPELSFDVYPYDLGEAGSYGLYVSSESGGYVRVAAFRVTADWSGAEEGEDVPGPEATPEPEKERCRFWWAVRKKIMRYVSRCLKLWVRISTIRDRPGADNMPSWPIRS